MSLYTFMVCETLVMFESQWSPSLWPILCMSLQNLSSYSSPACQVMRWAFSDFGHPNSGSSVAGFVWSHGSCTLCCSPGNHEPMIWRICTQPLQCSSISFWNSPPFRGSTTIPCWNLALLRLGHLMHTYRKPSILSKPSTQFFISPNFVCGAGTGIFWGFP
jgi:hypothetical protein